MTSKIHVLAFRSLALGFAAVACGAGPDSTEQTRVDTTQLTATQVTDSSSLIEVPLTGTTLTATPDPGTVDLKKACTSDQKAAALQTCAAQCNANGEDTCPDGINNGGRYCVKATLNSCTYNTKTHVVNATCEFTTKACGLIAGGSGSGRSGGDPIGCEPWYDGDTFCCDNFGTHCDAAPVLN
jgi:hypothetical protein